MLHTRAPTIGVRYLIWLSFFSLSLFLLFSKYHFNQLLMIESEDIFNNNNIVIDICGARFLYRFHLTQNRMRCIWFFVFKMINIIFLTFYIPHCYQYGRKLKVIQQLMNISIKIKLFHFHSWYHLAYS